MPKTASLSAKMRPACTVNEMAMTLAGSAPLAMACAIRWTRTKLLPLPAPAQSTRREAWLAMAAACSVDGVFMVSDVLRVEVTRPTTNTE